MRRALNHLRNIVNSNNASTVRKWRGTTSRPYTTAYPEQLIELYDREGCPQCRFVREALTELDLDAIIYPCPKGGERYADRLLEASGSNDVPFMFDPNSSEKLSGAQAIVDYLFKIYGQRHTPSALKVESHNLAQSEKVTAMRGEAGQHKCPSKVADELLTLYSFESSPFSRPVRERLCELELAYQLVNLSKQKKSDMGPAVMHFSLGKYKPLPNTKRAAFYAEHGNVQVPYLTDPNTGAALFQSKDILQYLEQRYAKI